MADWITPTSVDTMDPCPSGNPPDENASWDENLNHIIDDDPDSYAMWTSGGDSGSRGAVKASHTAMTGDKVRVKAGTQGAITGTVWVYYSGAWHNIGTLAFTEAWEEFNIGSVVSYTDIAIELVTTEDGQWWSTVFEIDFGVVFTQYANSPLVGGSLAR